MDVTQISHESWKDRHLRINNWTANFYAFIGKINIQQARMYKTIRSKKCLLQRYRWDKFIQSVARKCVKIRSLPTTEIRNWLWTSRDLTNARSANIFQRDGRGAESIRAGDSCKLFSWKNCSPDDNGIINVWWEQRIKNGRSEYLKGVIKWPAWNASGIWIIIIRRRSRFEYKNWNLLHENYSSICSLSLSLCLFFVVP